MKYIASVFIGWMHITKKSVSYRFDDDFIKLIGKYSDGNKTGFVEKSIAYYIRDLKNGADTQESDTPQQESAIQTDNQSPTHQLNIRIDELKGSMEKMENKHQEETMYWRDKIDDWEQRYDLQVLESNKKFDRLMKSIDESRSYSYLQNTGVRIEGMATNIDKVIEPPKEKQETETKGFWSRLFARDS